MKIERKHLVAQLADFARNGSGVIVGQPGIGKSYALGELRRRLKEERIPHLVLPVERLGDGGDSDMRAVLKRDGDFVELLKSSVAGVQTRAILIFDGFDAARGERERAGILRLITRAVRELSDTWNTVVSVRTFDAKKSEKLLKLFPAAREITANAGNCRSFEVPPLGEEDLAQAFQQLPLLRVLYEKGSAEFRELLTVPFNLWLIEQVLQSGAQAAELSSVTSEVQLLEFYWERRIRQTSDCEDRETLLLTITSQMVERHMLSIRRDRVYHARFKSAWEGLLSDEVLSEVREKAVKIAFTHNILFDFSVSVLLLDEDPQRFADFVAAEPARPLFLRPSLVYHFTWLWHFERKAFWENFWYVVERKEAHLRQIIRLVLPAVIVAEARAVADLQPIVSRAVAHPDIGAESISFALQALRVLGSPRSDLWADFLSQISNHLDERYAWDAGLVALRYVENSDLSPHARLSCASLGRALLRWAWTARGGEKKHWFERVAAILGIPIVAKTFAANRVESRELLVQILSVLDEPDFPVDCVFRLSNEVEYLIPEDPELVALIYERVFGHEEQSEERTNIGGPVLGLISNRRQDFDGCQYSLLQEFPQFLASAPYIAIEAGMKAVQGVTLRRHVLRYLREGKSMADLTFRFSFGSRSARYMADGSAIWDETSYPDRELELANAIFAWLGDAARRKDAVQIEQFLGVFVPNALLAFLWARLLFQGAEHPEILAPFLFELAIAPPILTEPDTVYALGTFIEKASPHLTESQRLQLEQHIMALPKDAGEKREAFEHRRNRLLGCIPPEYLVSEDVRLLRSELVKEAKLPKNQPLFSFETYSEPYTEDAYFRDRGAQPELPANRELRKLYQPLKDWTEKEKTASELPTLVAQARALETSLSEEHPADGPVKSAAWTHLASFASNAILLVDRKSEDFTALHKILLLAAEHPEPVSDAATDSKWDSPVWSPAPRTEAAKVLPWLIAVGQNGETVRAAKQLAVDAVPAVRFLISQEIWRMREKAAEAMWEIASRYVETEQNGTVLYGFSGSLWKLISNARERTLGMIQRLLNRVQPGEANDETCWSNLVRMLTDYAVKYDDPWASTQLRQWRAAPVQSAMALSVSGHRLIAHLQPQQTDDRFLRARELLISHLDAVAAGLIALQKSTDQSSTDSQSIWRALYGVIDEAVMRTYFAADISETLRARTENPLDDVAREKFFRATLPVLRKVLGFGADPTTGMLLAPTAHYLMQLLNGVVKYDPPLVLELAAEVVSCSRRYNYNLDSLALREVVALVETLLADYRDRIQDDASVNHLLTVLDAFVEVGWPEALSLVWRLDEIYR